MKRKKGRESTMRKREEKRRKTEIWKGKMGKRNVKRQRKDEGVGKREIVGRNW